MSNRYTAKVSESLKLRGWIDEIQAKALRADNARLKGEVEAEIRKGGRLAASLDLTASDLQRHKDQLATYKAAVVEARKLIKDVFGHYTAEDIEHLKTLYDKKVAGEYCVCDVLNAQTTLHTLSALTCDATKTT